MRRNEAFSLLESFCFYNQMSLRDAGDAARNSHRELVELILLRSGITPDNSGPAFASATGSGRRTIASLLQRPGITPDHAGQLRLAAHPG